MDDSAWTSTLNGAAPMIESVRGMAVHGGLFEAAQQCLAIEAGKILWLRMDTGAGPADLPVVLYETVRPLILEAWVDIRDAVAVLQHLTQSPAGRELLGSRSRLAEWVRGLGAAGAGPDLAEYVAVLIDHARARWAGHGLLCLASDLLRLQALAWRPGAYVDVGDVAGLLAKLPSLRGVYADLTPFCAHCTVAIENDLIFCADRAVGRALMIATLLWSLQSMEQMAEKLLPAPGRPPASGWTGDSGMSIAMAAPSRACSPRELADAVLPAIDARMPKAPALRELFAWPHVDLANYINRAYGSSHLVGDPTTLEAYFEGRAVKEYLIDHVGGFTGYQLFAGRLAPSCRGVWQRCCSAFGLQDYAPQLGWKTHGFGTLERLVDLGRRLARTACAAPGVRRDLEAIGKGLGMSLTEISAAARRVADVYDALRQAHLDPGRRDLLVRQALVRSCRL
jgi:hypothetical protein